MEEEKNETKKDSPAPKLNVLERLIKLDKKNSSLTLIDKHKNQKLLIRSLSMNPSNHWTGNQAENTLSTFWKHISEYYFKKVDESDIDRINFLINLISTPVKDAEVKYADYHAYQTFKKVINPIYKHIYPEPRNNKQNVRNLQKTYLIDTLKNITAPKQTPSKISKVQKQIADLKFVPKQSKGDKSKKFIKSFLNEETAQLDDIISKLLYTEKEEKDTIGDELEKLMKDQRNLNEQNLDALEALQVKAEREQILNMKSDTKKEEISIKNSSEYDKILRNKKRNLTSAGHIDTQLKYLQNLIIHLENMQAAESIKYVVDVAKPTDTHGKYKFCVIFDEALCPKETWVEESVLDTMDKLREQSIFKNHNVPQKTQHSLNSSNIIGFHYCNQKFQNKTTQMKDKPWKDLMKKRINDVFDGFKKEDAFLKSRQYGMCHHCRYLFPNEHLISCNYRSSKMGLPIVNPAYTDPLNTGLTGQLAKRSTSNKRGLYSSYIKSNGELVCLRTYCRQCLKQNYDCVIPDILNKNDWVCPFCNGNCYCSRCLRTDHLNKLFSIFLMLGGDINDINKDSYLDKYVLTHQDPDEFLKTHNKKTPSYYALKPTPGRKGKIPNGEVKTSVKEYREHLKKYQFYKNIRIHMEKVRLLCSQLTKRENLKLRLDLLNNELFQLETQNPPNITGQKRRGRKPKLVKEEPPVTKKLKRKMFAEPESEESDIAEEEILEDDEEEEEEDEEDEIEDSEEDEEEDDEEEDEEEVEADDDEEEEYSPFEEDDELETVPVIKKRRGRPPKVKPKSYIKRTSSLTARKIEKATAAIQTPRKRGRPPKNPPATEEPPKLTQRKGTSISPERSTSKRRSLSATKLKTPPKRKDRDTPISYIQFSPSTSRRSNPDENPNEPADNYQFKPKGPILKKELQKILSHQSWNQFDVLKKTANLGRVTRNSMVKPKGRKNKRNDMNQES